MASGLNKVMIIGNLGQDPDVRNTNSGNKVANLRVAVSERRKDRNGEWGDATEWVGVVCFGKTAENVGEYLTKGRQVYVEGRLQTRQWEDREGNKRYTTEVVAFNVLFLGGKGETRKSSDGWSGGDSAEAKSIEEDVGTLPF